VKERQTPKKRGSGKSGREGQTSILKGDNKPLRSGMKRQKRKGPEASIETHKIGPGMKREGPEVPKGTDEQNLRQNPAKAAACFAGKRRSNGSKMA